MIRDEEFNDIPELGPARDALDQPDIPTLKQTSAPAVGSCAPKAADPVTASERRGAGLMPWLLLLLMLVVGAGGYWGMEHFNRLQQQLALAHQRLADLEGLISATDASANKSGAALQVQIEKFLLDSGKRLKHVDSEIAKLWTLAYQRNKPKIAEIDATVAGLNKQSSRLAAQLEQAKTGQQQTVGDLKLLQQGLLMYQASLKDLGAQLELRDQANQELYTLQDAQLAQLERRLQGLYDNPPMPEALSRSVKEHEQAIAAINSFRKQVNSQLLRLEARVGQLQRSSTPAKAAGITAVPGNNVPAPAVAPVSAKSVQ